MMKKGMILLIILLLAGCGSTKKSTQNVEAPKPVKYVTANVFEKDVGGNYAGTIAASSETKMSFKVSGNIKKIYVKMGDKVKAGELLAEIEPQDYKLQKQSAESTLENAKIGVTEAKARLQLAETSYEQAKIGVEQAKTAVMNAKIQLESVTKKYDRLVKLYEEGNISVEDYENIKFAKESAKLNYDNATAMESQARANVKNSLSAIEQAKAGVKLSEAVVNSVEKSVEMANLQVDYTKLYSPVDGEVVMKTVSENENVSAGMPIVIINSGSRFEVKIFVPETVVAKLRTGQNVKITVDAAEGRKLTGKIKEIGSASTGFGITYPVTIVLNGEYGAIRAGMTAEAELELKEKIKSKAVILPGSAVGKDTEGNFVYVINKKDESYSLEKRKVLAGEISSDGIEIKGGIKAGEMVLAAGLRFADEGMPVKLLQDKE